MRLIKTQSNGDLRFVDLYHMPNYGPVTFLMKFDRVDPDNLNHYVVEKSLGGDHFDEFVDIMMKGSDSAPSTQEPTT